MTVPSALCSSRAGRTAATDSAAGGRNGALRAGTLECRGNGDRLGALLLEAGKPAEKSLLILHSTPAHAHPAHPLSLPPPNRVVDGLHAAPSNSIHPGHVGLAQPLPCWRAASDALRFGEPRHRHLVAPPAMIETLADDVSTVAAPGGLQSHQRRSLSPQCHHQAARITCALKPAQC